MIYEPGNYYHLINRGCNRESIFNCQADYMELINRIKVSDYKSYVNIIAWCLMPNHYHFLVQQNSDKPASRWIRYIFNGYSQFFNQKNERSGT
ncbi:MAG: transposase [Candidatus Cloacimonetes bacterium]|nr:transposase [Candidatus Cloacimonadota bacterium]